MSSAVDSSEPSARGLDEAIRLAKAQGGKLHIVHVVDELAPLAAGGYSLAKGVLAKAVEAAHRQGISAEGTLLECIGGRVAGFIVEEAKRCGADLIVLGTHGRRGLSRLAMGSDAEEVVRSAPVPVLLVRGGK